LIFRAKGRRKRDLSIESKEITSPLCFKVDFEDQKVKPGPNPFFGFEPGPLIGYKHPRILEWLVSEYRFQGLNWMVYSWTKEGSMNENHHFNFPLKIIE
jgi:hypothetical protein